MRPVSAQVSPVDDRELDYILNHLGEDRAAQRGAVSPPIYQTAMFCYESVGQMREQIADEFANPFYTRGSNPTTQLLRQKMAALECAEDSLVFASGSAAIAAAVISVVKQGDHVLCAARPYTWTNRLLTQLLPRFGIDHDFIEGGTVADFESRVRDNTTMVILESPNSLVFTEQDLSAIADWARSRNITTLCDNSYATPLGQRPIELGIDLVAHSATKYLNGHSDVIAGVLAGTNAAMRELFYGPFMTLGAAIGPSDAWLLLRGLRTLPVRLERSRATAQHVAERLRSHPKVSAVHYPKKCQSGMLSIEIASDIAGVERFCDRLQHFLLTCSWGAYESLALPICASFATDAPPGDWPPPTLVRLSVGLESAETLMADLEQALAGV